ncbi:hypothetical protein SP19_89 [Salmonella phage 19]|nr:hypothetical protein SP19_89 [Salmonella phage 19]
MDFVTWLTMHNTWVPGTAVYIMMFVWLDTRPVFDYSFR